MNSEIDREQLLRRLLADAVEPVEPAPGAQTRLLARARAQAHRRKSRGPLIMRWGVPVALASLVIVGVVTLAFAIRSGDRGGSSASTAAGSAAGSAPSAAAKAPPGAAASSAASNAQLDAPGVSPLVPSPRGLSSLGKSVQSPRFNSSAQSTGSATAAGPDALSLERPDLDGDGMPDTVAVVGSKLTATLSRVGEQTVALPPPVGPGQRVLGATTLSDPNGKAVPVIFVRLTAAGADATDTVVAIVDGRLTVLRQGSEPVLLTIDPTHGYGCDQRALALAGDTTPLVVDGVQLVASPQLRGLITPAGKVTGCF